MVYAIIDVGSNSIRLSVYKINGDHFKRLFTKKSMAGLASYIVDGELSSTGISRACRVLAEYRTLLDNSTVTHVSVFATASLRNITNTLEAVNAIEKTTGYSIEVLSGYEEASYGYYGAQPDCDSLEGLLVDIGGGSTEVVYFKDKKVELAQSMPIGCLSLYTSHVSKLLPKGKEIDPIKEQIGWALSDSEVMNYPHCDNLFGVGGTARATMKLANNLYSLDSGNRNISMLQLTELRKTLCRHDQVARDLIIKTCPERVHTIVPGILILDSIAKRLEIKELTISRFGVREGYLCQRILSKQL